MKECIYKVCSWLCIMNFLQSTSLQPIAPEMRFAIIEEIIQDVSQFGSINLAFVRDLDVDTRSQLEEALQSSIISLQNQLLSQTQISLIKTVCFLAAGGAFSGLCGYLYFYVTGIPHLNNWWFDSARYRNLQEAIHAKDIPQNLTVSDVHKSLAIAEFSIQQAKRKFLNSLIGLGISIASHIAGITLASHAAEILKVDEERKLMIVNLQEALAELLEDAVL